MPFIRVCLILYSVKFDELSLGEKAINFVFPIFKLIYYSYTHIIDKINKIYSLSKQSSSQQFSLRNIAVSFVTHIYIHTKNKTGPMFVPGRTLLFNV